jgi:hypothetical protein
MIYSLMGAPPPPLRKNSGCAPDGRNPMNKARRLKPIPNLNSTPSGRAKQRIPHCYRGTVSLKARLYWSITWVQPHDQNWTPKPYFDAINWTAFRFDWSKKGYIIRTTKRFNTIKHLDVTEAERTSLSVISGFHHDIDKIALFWDIPQHRVVILYRLWPNVGKVLPLDAA